LRIWTSIEQAELTQDKNALLTHLIPPSGEKGRVEKTHNWNELFFGLGSAENRQFSLHGEE
jgi:hypothetical protein